MDEIAHVRPPPCNLPCNKKLLLVKEKVGWSSILHNVVRYITACDINSPSCLAMLLPSVATSYRKIALCNCALAYLFQVVLESESWDPEMELQC